jgi:hypothetical protein
MVTAAILATNIIIGISVAKYLSIDNPRLRASVFAVMNFSYSGCCELRIRISAEPMMLSFIVLFNLSITSRVFLNNTLTFLRTKKNAPPIIGTIETTANANFQLSMKSKMQVPTIIKTDETIVTIACDTNIFTESISEVRFVNSLEGLALRIYENPCREIFSESFVRMSFATRSDAYVWMMLCKYVRTKITKEAMTN